MFLLTHLHGGCATLDGLPLQPDFTAVGSKAGPVPDDSGVLKTKQTASETSKIGYEVLQNGQSKGGIDLETWFQLTGVFPDVLMVNRVVLFAPISYLENPPDGHLGTPAGAEQTSDWESECFISLWLRYRC